MEMPGDDRESARPVRPEEEATKEGTNVVKDRAHWGAAKAEVAARRRAASRWLLQSDGLGVEDAMVP